MLLAFCTKRRLKLENGAHNRLEIIRVDSPPNQLQRPSRISQPPRQLSHVASRFRCSFLKKGTRCVVGLVKETGVIIEDKAGRLPTSKPCAGTSRSPQDESAAPSSSFPHKTFH